eukprot:5957221-Amphidinium_carterae.1
MRQHAEGPAGAQWSCPSLEHTALQWRPHNGVFTDNHFLQLGSAHAPLLNSVFCGGPPEEYFSLNQSHPRTPSRMQPNSTWSGTENRHTPSHLCCSLALASFAKKTCLLPSEEDMRSLKDAIHRGRCMAI